MTNRDEIESVKYNEWRQRERKVLQRFDDVTKNPMLEQEKILEHILSKNAETEYLQKYGLDGATDAKTFRERVPLSDYDSYKPYMDRTFEGDTSPMLCVDPVIEVLRSSGTSGGQPKKFLGTQEVHDHRLPIFELQSPFLNRALPGLEKGKTVSLLSTRKSELTPGGLPYHPVGTSIVNNSSYRKLPPDPANRQTSPWQVLFANDDEEAMYCHLLLGLLQREEVFLLATIFAATIQRAVRFFEDSWQDICQDIANGTLHPRVREDRVRTVVLPMLRKDPELAELVRRQFAGRKASDGFLRRLWPNLKAINCICTGSMKAYLPAIATYSDNLPVICTYSFTATEGNFGANVDPLCSPADICYTAIPFSAYFEFLGVPDAQEELASESTEVVDLLGVKQDREYELLMTTVAGLYRYRMGDIFRVVGFYNSTPKFKFVRRRSTVLSINVDKTDENELHTAVSEGAKVLDEELGWRLLEYTSTANFESYPGHYVIFWELIPSESPKRSPDETELEQCCTEMEASLNVIYRRGRHENVVGPLELRVVQEGTFDRLLKYALSQGGSIQQYKTPRGIDASRTAQLNLLNSNVSQKAFAPGKPPFP